MSACIFCKIVRGELPSTNVFEDEQCLAFKDVNPQAPVHILVVPKRHISSLEECHETDVPLLGRLLEKCRPIARQQGLSESGYRIVINTGQESGQTVFHIHLHILGGRMMHWPPG